MERYTLAEYIEKFHNGCQKDFADRAGLTAATVSRALKGVHFPGPNTRRKVDEFTDHKIIWAVVNETETAAA